jgi:hypothetical protein
LFQEPPIGPYPKSAKNRRMGLFVCLGALRAREASGSGSHLVFAWVRGLRERLDGAAGGH